MNISDVKHAVRLSEMEIAAIQESVKALLGDDASVYLFGSRARGDAKGGDIDLLVETKKSLPNRVVSACRLTSELQMRLGDQKIDLILIDATTPLQPIHEIARQTGVKL